MKSPFWRYHFSSKCAELGIPSIETCPGEDHVWEVGVCINCDQSELEYWFKNLKQSEEWKETEQDLANILLNAERINKA